MNIMTVPFSELKAEVKRVLMRLSFSRKKKLISVQIFLRVTVATGVYSHGLNRFPVFSRPGKKRIDRSVSRARMRWEKWIDGNMGWSSRCWSVQCKKFAWTRAIELAKQNRWVVLRSRNNNHWMRGGYLVAWQAAEAGCIGICFTNALAGMPPWVAKSRDLEIIRWWLQYQEKKCHVVLDMAMSQFSYGKMQEYELKGSQLPFAGGYDREGNLSTDPAAIRQTKRALPAGFGKVPDLPSMMDILLAMLAGGRSTAKITASGNEFGLSQCFICFHKENLHEDLVDESPCVHKNCHCAGWS